LPAVLRHPDLAVVADGPGQPLVDDIQAETARRVVLRIRPFTPTTIPCCSLINPATNGDSAPTRSVRSTTFQSAAGAAVAAGSCGSGLGTAAVSVAAGGVSPAEAAPQPAKPARISNTAARVNNRLFIKTSYYWERRGRLLSRRRLDIATA
jgi:hypothetical protein